MPRPLRIQFPGAIYHLMNRGDRREPIFRDDHPLYLRPARRPAWLRVDRLLESAAQGRRRQG